MLYTKRRTNVSRNSYKKPQGQYFSNGCAIQFDGLTLDLKVDVININYDIGAEILKRSPALNAYSYIIYRSRVLKKEGLTPEQAMAQIEQETKADRVAKKFFDKHRLGGMKMIYDELTEEEYRDIIRKGERNLGRKETAHEIATNMKKAGTPLDFIKKMTGLAEDEIAAL